MKYRIISILVLGIILSCNSKNSLELAQERYPMLEPCKPDGINEKILCGTIEVFEDQNNKVGKKISLNVFLFPTFGQSPSSSVFIDYNGGPGVPNNVLIPLYEKESFLSRFRELRDVLIIEKRGTGASAIGCSALDSIPLPLDYYLYNTDLISDCLKEIQDRVDLSHYNTAAQVEDMETIRKWLDIEKYDFHGISYGTRVGLELIRKYPSAVRSAILTGAVPPEFGLFDFVDFEIERVLQKLILRCETDSMCRTSFPNFKAQLYGLRKRLKESPESYNYLNKITNEKHKIHFTDSTFLVMIANFFYSGTKLERLPGIVNEAHSGNFTPLIESNLSPLQLAIPLHLSQFCPEESNRHPVKDLEALDTLYTKGMAALTEFNACSVWEQLPSPDWVNKSIGGNTAMLLFSGEDDVLTPPRMNDSIHLLFPNSRHIVFPDQGHAYTDWSCWDNLVYQFLESNGTVDNIDTSCVSTIKRPNFVLELN